MKNCQAYNCQNKNFARGFCSKHYTRWIRYGDISVVHTPTRNICKFEGCDKFCSGQGYCSKHYQRIYKRGTLELSRDWGQGKTHQERFWSRVVKTEKCWLWKGAKIKNGYGTVTVNYRKWYAHRYSWFLTFGIEPNLHLLHSCDTPLCVNPTHLREGTDAENAKDMVERGRSLKGELQPNSKLTEKDVLAIRDYVANGGTQAAMVRKYSLSTATVFNIVNRKMWTHI